MLAEFRVVATAALLAIVGEDRTGEKVRESARVFTT